MRIGCTIPFSHLTPVDYIGAAARYLETVGFHSMWVPEHVLFFPEYASRYPYSPTGRVPGEPEGVLDPFTTLTFVAAHTSTIRLGTGVCLVPQRQPVYTAKMVADLDYLSVGRVDFGVPLELTHDSVLHADVGICKPRGTHDGPPRALTRTYAISLCTGGKGKLCACAQ